MDKLTFFAVTAFARCLYMPFFAHFGFVVLMCCFLFKVQLAQAVGIGTLVIKLTEALFHEVFAQLGFVVYAKVLNVLYHFFSGRKLNLLFWSLHGWHEIGVAGVAAELLH